MKAWQIALERQLSAAEAPGVLTLGALARAAAMNRGAPVEDSSLHHWIKSAIATDRLRRVQRGLYLNGFRSPPGRAAEAAGHLRRDAIVSLHTALADAGVLNNPPTIITAVVPIDKRASAPTLGTVRTEVGIFSFRGLPRRLLEAGDAGDRLDLTGHPNFPCASAEKALLDWLYLAASPRSNLAAPARHDVDVDAMDTRKLRRLARTMNLHAILDSWLLPGRHARAVRMAGRRR
jgi:hypothetical protein